MQHAMYPKTEFDSSGFRENYSKFTPSQKHFVDIVLDWSQNPRKILLVLSGGPGTGKSYVVKNTLDYVKTQQLRMSYTAHSAQVIGGQTIHSAIQLNFKNPFLCDLEKKLEDETDLVKSIKASREVQKEFKYYRYPNVIVIDEVSMIKGWFMYWLIRFFMDRTDQPLLFITMGDPHQLNPVKCNHNLFSFKFHKTIWDIRLVHLKESKRFEYHYGLLIDKLRLAVDRKDESGLFALISEHYPIVEDIEYEMVTNANRAMAFKNEWVDTFNNYYIKNMVNGPEIYVEEDLTVKPECLLFCTENGSVANGTELIFVEYRDNRVLCRNAKTRELVEIRRGSRGRFCLKLGFAATVHKFQGVTLNEEKIIIHFSGNKDLNLVYTALSRVKCMDQIIAVCL